MKRCNKCKEKKDFGEFGKNRSLKDGFQNRCRECRNNYQREWYGSNQTLQKSRTGTRRLSMRKTLREHILSILSKSSCLDCGLSNMIVLDFDHRENKKFNISEGPSKGVALQTLIDEIAKCDIRCANCHRIKTAKAINSFRYVRYLELNS